MASKMIDIHPHIIALDTKKYPITPLGGKRSGWSASRPKTFEELVAGMNEGVVDKACIVHSSTTYGYDASYVADIVAANPGRFTGTMAVDMCAADASEKIRYWFGRKLTGIRIFSAGSTFDKQSDVLSDPRSFPAWDTCTELGISVCTQLRPEGLPQLITLIKRFPRTTILVDHLLKPPIADGAPYTTSQYLFDLAQYPNVYLKLSTGNIRDSRKGKGTPETFFPLLVKHFGANRIAWGSNFPASEGTLPQMAKEAREALACLSQSDQEWIFAKTAQKLYPALADK
jgi:predicted TIM-barrel fold metal-dependent hydrolase